MGRTKAVAEWSAEDEGLVVELDATEFIAALHGEDAAAETAVEIHVSLPQQVNALQQAV